MDQQTAIRDMINSIGSGKSAEVQSKFNVIMQARASEALSDYKTELARSVFKNPQMQAMGLADGDEHILEVDTDVYSGDEDEDV